MIACSSPGKSAQSSGSAGNAHAQSGTGTSGAAAGDTDAQTGIAGSHAGSGAQASPDAGTSTTAADGGATGTASHKPDAAASDTDAGPIDVVPAVQGPSAFHGVNWADTRDNFVDGLLQLSGLDSSADSYSTVQNKARQILTQVRSELGADTIRIPINEPTVSSAWWQSYKAVIDTATAMDMKVMVTYWAHHNGKPDDEAAFKAMWQTVVSEYSNNNRVYFDIHNEPYGFGKSWLAEAAKWLGYFPSLPRARVIVAGTGYDDNVTSVGGDSRFAECLLELHIYGFQHTGWTTTKQWTDGVNAAIGGYAARTIVGEWGDTMSSGLNYNATAVDGNNALSYVVTLSNIVRKTGMGSVYWPGLRDGDGYAMTKRTSSGTTQTLTVVNKSGLDRLHWSWHQ